MMENRSFDHFLGWMPHANGRQNGLTYLDKQGVPHHTYHLTDYQNCNLADPDHSYTGGRIQYDNGACDGWLRAGTDDLFPIGFYTAKDLSFLSQAAPQWTVYDNYFAGILAPTYPNRFYQHAAQTDRLDQSTSISVLPTIWDSLSKASLQGRYFYSDIPFTAFWGFKYLGISRPFAEFLTLCASGQLPQVSFVDPRFVRRVERHLRRRPPARRYPQRRGFPEPGLHRRNPKPGLAQHRPDHQLRRVGRLLRPRPAAGRPHPLY